MIKAENTKFVLCPKARIEGNFETLWYYIAQALPPSSSHHALRKGNILRSLQSGNMQCWLGWEKNGAGYSLAAIATTAIVNDTVTGDRNLLIYSFTYEKNFSPDAIVKHFETIKRFARVNKCMKVIAYTGLPVLTKLVEKYLNGKSSTFLEMEV
jgi:hypothetical protein